jgi:lysozyme
MENLIKGIDVSRWQGTDMNWKQIISDGNLFSFMKATDGSAYKRQLIEMGIKQATDAKNAGLKIGYYHFAHPNNTGGVEKDAIGEAQFFATTVKEFPKPNFPLVLDLEDEKMNLSPQEAKAWIDIFQTTLKNAGFELMIYSTKSFLDRKLPPNHNYGSMPLWLAYYPKVFDINKPPAIPNGWQLWNIWQYSDHGKVPSLAQVDVNIMSKEFFDKY